MKRVAIITARGGSKRIPRKNIKDFLGKPIIAYSIEAALKSGLFDEVMVSTDDNEISEIAKNYGAIVPFMRSDKNSDDYSGTFDVIKEVLESYKEKGIKFDQACCIYPTAPFVTSDKLIEAYNVLNSSDIDSVFPVMGFGYPIQRGLIVDESNKIKMREPQYFSSRSQDLEPVFHDAGQFYFFDINKVLKENTLWTKNTGFIEINEIEGQDIDNETDWKLAEMKYKLLHEK
ncbi:MAG: pseudaminic acid cytidylyltransferase [Flavobacteriaceae bacterium]|nr:pseudaminic acid cytidylyltransferase [Flavobacteriaceae bacterium]